MIVPISTTNMTGFLIWSLGFCFLIESTSAWRRISPSKRLRASATPRGALTAVAVAVAVLAVVAVDGESDVSFTGVPFSLDAFIRRISRGAVARGSVRGPRRGRR